MGAYRVSPWEAKIADDRKPGEFRSGKWEPVFHPSPGKALTWIAVAAWLAEGAQLATRLLDGEASAALRIAAFAVTVLAAITMLCQRIEANSKATTESIKGLINAHTEAMTEHVLAVERFFQLSVRAAEYSERDARLATGTGPFTVYRGGG